MPRKVECFCGISGKGSQLFTGQALRSYLSALQNSAVMLQQTFESTLSFSPFAYLPVKHFLVFWGLYP